jgi:hypothetical protein
MFRTYAKRFAPFSPTDKIEITKTIRKTFQSFGVAVSIQENVYHNDDQEFLSYTIHLPYEGNVENNTSGRSMSPSVFFSEGGFLEFILSELNKSPLIKEYKAKASTSTTAKEGTTKVPGKLFDIQSYDFIISMRSYKEEEYIEPKPYVPKHFTYVDIDLRGRGQGTPSKIFEYIKKNEEFRNSIGITPEIQNIIDSTRLEYGTCQICGRIMKMIVSGENTNRILNEKGTIVRHHSIDVPNSPCRGVFRLPYELSRDTLKKYIAEYKAGGIVKPVNRARLAELESRYASWKFKDPTKTPWGVSKPKAKQRTVEDFLKSWEKKLEKDKLKTSPVFTPTPVITPAVKPKAPPVVKRTPKAPPVVKTPAVKPKTPPVKRTPAVKLSVNETLFSNSLAYLNADFDLYNLQPQEAIYVISELKPITDKLPGSAKPAPSKGGLPLLWVNKLIAELKELSSFYDLGDLEGEEVKMVMASLKPILDKMPVTFTNKKASFRYWV